MRFNRRFVLFEAVTLGLILALTGAVNGLRADTGTCSGATINLPFADVAGNAFFCQIAAAYFSGLTNGTTPTTFSPSNTVTRDQMTAFIGRTLDQSLKRGGTRAALNQYWTTKPPYNIAVNASHLGTTSVGVTPVGVAADGEDLWVASYTTGTVSRVRASSGRLLEIWTGVPKAWGVLVALGRVFVTGQTDGGSLYMIDPSSLSGVATTVATNLGIEPRAMAFDGSRIWITKQDGVVTVTAGPSFDVTVMPGFNNPRGIVYDGANMWIANQGTQALVKVAADGTVLQSVPIGALPAYPVFDGANIWVPERAENKVVVVRAATGAVLATLKDNGLNDPTVAAFDGQRVMVISSTGVCSLWKATDLTPLGYAPIGLPAAPGFVCSDGINFWLTLSLNGSPGKLARF
jgi:hypothetical protein